MAKKTDEATLSRRRREILDTIRESIRERGYPPSVREIAQNVGLASPSTVKHHIDALEEAGFIRRLPGQARCIELTEQGLGDSRDPRDAQGQAPATVHEIEIPVSHADQDTVPVPLVGQIAAGAPITAEQHVEDTFELPTSLTGQGNVFMLRVNGESMIDAGILDGDYVVVRSQPTAVDGQTVAAMIDGEATVKILSHADGHVWLLPKNESYSPIPGDEATILGLVVTVIRCL